MLNNHILAAALLVAATSMTAAAPAAKPPAKKAPNAAVNTAWSKLNFTIDPAASEVNQSAYRENVYREYDDLFAQDFDDMLDAVDFDTELRIAMKDNGLDSSNLGDVIAMTLIGAWNLVNDKEPGISKGYAGTRTLVEQMVLKSHPGYARMTNATKQKEAQWMLLDNAKFEALMEHDPERREPIKDELATEIKLLFGVDLYKLTLTPQGLQPKAK